MQSRLTGSRPRGRRHPGLPVAYVAFGALAALGGARPTSIAVLDPALLALGGAAAAACAVRARTLAVYVAGGLAASLQPELVPAVIGLAGLGCALASRLGRQRSLLDACAGGLGWACAVGVPAAAGARPVVVAVAGFAWLAWSAHRHGSHRFRQRSGWVIGVVGGLALAGGGLGVLAAAMARADVERGADLLESGLRAARSGDTEVAVADLRAARRALGAGEATLGALWARPAWIVPGVSQNARALHTVVAEVDDLAAVAIDTADAADVEAIQARGGRIDLAAVAAVEEPLERVLAALAATDGRLEDLEDRWLLPSLRERLADVRGELAAAIPSVELARDGARVAPALLGAEDPSTYLVLFTTPTEARATTGFPGNYAEITFTDGAFDMTRFGRIAELDRPEGAPDPVISGPEDFLVRYARFGSHRDFRNLTMSPDFPAVAAVAAELYPQSGGTEIDGVLSVDPSALAALLDITGPVAVPGVEGMLTAANAERFLLVDQYVQLGDSPGRVDALETLAEVTFERLETADLPGPRALGERFGPLVEEGHLQLYAFADGAPSVLDRLGLSGRYPAVRGDFIGVTTTNAAASKIDVFLRRSLDYLVKWDPSTGALAATATITLTNEAPSSGLPAYLIGNALGDRLGEEPLPDGWHNVFVTLYTPWDTVGATLDGEPIPLSRMAELDRWALSTMVAIPPGESRTLVVELSGVLLQRRYRLDLAPQPLVEPETATVTVRAPGGAGLKVTGPIETDEIGATGTFPLVRDVRITAQRR